MTFAYRADDRLRINLNVSWEGKTYAVRFTDRDDPNTGLGTIKDVKTDNLWHVAVVPLSNG